MSERPCSYRDLAVHGPGWISCIFTLLWLAAFFPCSATQVCAAREEFPAPKWLDRVEVAEKMVINGLPSTVHSFKADKSIEELLDFYRQRWNDGPPGRPGYREASIPPWHIISRLDGRNLYTVQVQTNDASGLQGYLAIGDLEGLPKKGKNSSKVPRMDDSKVINDVISFDPGKKGRTLLLVNRYSVASNSAFYRNYYLDAGWGKLVDTDSEEAHLLVFKKYDQEAHLVINHLNGSTQVVMNIVENN